MKNSSSCITLTVIDNHNMVEEIRVSIIIIKISNVNMCILCDLKGQCLNHDHVAHVYEYIGAECFKLRLCYLAYLEIPSIQVSRIPGDFSETGRFGNLNLKVILDNIKKFIFFYGKNCIDSTVNST